MEKILDIKETGWYRGRTSYDGYIITTDQQVIKVGIDDGSRCCENFGYFSTPDDLKDFIGATLLGVESVDDCLNVKELTDMYVSIDSAYFINIQTDRGTFQLTVYNEHNGYYGHDVIVESSQLTMEEYL